MQHINMFVITIRWLCATCTTMMPLMQSPNETKLLTSVLSDIFFKDFSITKQTMSMTDHTAHTYTHTHTHSSSLSLSLSLSL